MDGSTRKPVADVAATPTVIQGSAPLAPGNAVRRADQEIAVVGAEGTAQATTAPLAYVADRKLVGTLNAQKEQFANADSKVHAPEGVVGPEAQAAADKAHAQVKLRMSDEAAAAGRGIGKIGVNAREAVLEEATNDVASVTAKRDPFDVSPMAQAQKETAQAKAPQAAKVTAESPPVIGGQVVAVSSGTAPSPEAKTEQAATASAPVRGTEVKQAQTSTLQQTASAPSLASTQAEPARAPVRQEQAAETTQAVRNPNGSIRTTVIGDVPVASATTPRVSPAEQAVNEIPAPSRHARSLPTQDNWQIHDLSATTAKPVSASAGKPAEQASSDTGAKTPRTLTLDTPAARLYAAVGKPMAVEPGATVVPTAPAKKNEADAKVSLTGSSALTGEFTESSHIKGLLVQDQGIKISATKQPEVATVSVKSEAAAAPAATRYQAAKKLDMGSFGYSLGTGTGR